MDTQAIDVDALKAGEKLRPWAESRLKHWAALPQITTGGIGDINGTTVGSGSRFDSGKLRVDLLPLSLIEAVLCCDDFYAAPQFPGPRIRFLLGKWQRSGDTEYLYSALAASINLKGMGDSWTFEHFRDCIKVLEYGTVKYAEWNWARGMKWSVPYGCALRHLDAIARWEQVDPESQCSHMGHVTANILFMVLYHQKYPELNDMPFAVLKPPCSI